MPVSHVVMFKFRDDATPKEIQPIVQQMLDLKNECLHPGTSRPYIISSKGGRENSIEGSQTARLYPSRYQNGLTHIFIIEFNNCEDRDYYVRSDPAHLLFLQAARSFIDKVQVVDFAAGVW
uniref:Stress-response A/B barrel domain-containing protein n=1 Tax=Talaromyces marneffei PM1 TaxID=1077442 RepID=A0A093UQA2_TALMA